MKGPDFTTKVTARQSRNRNSDYLAQSSQSTQRKRDKFPNLASLARLARGVSEDLRKLRKFSTIVVRRARS